MRTISEICIAVQEADTCITDEELRLCVESLRVINQCLQRCLMELIAAIQQHKPEHAVQLRATNTWHTLERLFDAKKTDPRTFLGPSNIPGSDEYARQLQTAKAVFKSATGVQLD